MKIKGQTESGDKYLPNEALIEVLLPAYDPCQNFSDMEILFCFLIHYCNER